MVPGVHLQGFQKFQLIVPGQEFIWWKLQMGNNSPLQYILLQAILYIAGYIMYYIKSQYLSWVGSHRVFWLFFTGNNNKSIIYKIVDKNEVLCGQQIET